MADWALAAHIDHTLLRPEASEADVARLCDEAMLNGFFAVCVQPIHVEASARRLAGSGVRVVSVVAFPHGASVTPSKAFEARHAVADGADEVDMVANLGWLCTGALARAQDEIASVVAAAAPGRVKVIIECALLGDERKIEVARAVQAGGATFVKTSTGFGPGGATEGDIRLLRAAVGPSFGVKASGGIKTRAQALAMLAAGADRLGTSAGVAIVTSAAGA